MRFDLPNGSAVQALQDVSLDLKEGELMSQLYGNISLEKIRINQQPSYFKLLASVYSDRLYYDAKPFDDLMDQLFERP